MFLGNLSHLRVSRCFNTSKNGAQSANRRTATIVVCPAGLNPEGFCPAALAAPQGWLPSRAEVVAVALAPQDFYKLSHTFFHPLTILCNVTFLQSQIVKAKTTNFAARSSFAGGGERLLTLGFVSILFCTLNFFVFSYYFPVCSFFVLTWLKMVTRASFAKPSRQKNLESKKKFL